VVRQGLSADVREDGVRARASTIAVASSFCALTLPPPPPTQTNNTPLAYAAMHGYVDIALFLLEHGADVNARTHDGLTALLLAAKHGQPAMMRTLLEAGADLRLKDNYRRSALMFAAMCGSSECVGILLSHGVSKKDHDEVGWRVTRPVARARTGLVRAAARPSLAASSYCSCARCVVVIAGAAVAASWLCRARWRYPPARAHGDVRVCHSHGWLCRVPSQTTLSLCSLGSPSRGVITRVSCRLLPEVRVVRAPQMGKTAFDWASDKHAVELLPLLKVASWGCH
jgi:ankyrin repeat protein